MNFIVLLQIKQGIYGIRIFEKALAALCED